MGGQTGRGCETGATDLGFDACMCVPERDVYSVRVCEDICPTYTCVLLMYLGQGQLAG